MDSPSQGGFDIPADSTIFKESELTIKLIEHDVVYVANMENDSTMKGTFTQRGYELPLNLKKKATE